jgi:hypothetical protein
MMPLAPADMGRLAKVCALFSSNHVGERAAAAATADRIVKGAGLSWSELLRLPVPGDSAPARCGVLSAADILALYNDRLTQWERSFLTDLTAWRGHPTRRQSQVLEKIRVRCGAP